MNNSRVRSAIKRIQSVTPAQLAITVALTCMFTLLVILYEARTGIIQREIVQAPSVPVSEVTLKLTQRSVSSIDAFVKGLNYVDAITVYAVDMADNTQTMAYKVYLTQGKLVTTVSETTTPLFTSDVKRNAEITALLNGQFSCTTDTRYANGSGYATTCRVPVPPFYGKLSGYIVVQSTKELSIYTIDQLRREALQLSLEIYYTSINNAAEPYPIWSSK